ncbi:glycosyltransferase family 22 protein [Sporormia fimetaria CBS 119925]|uniref:Mannosyltransferase n=1 Tax=Sporormia fimetaria CBS 119925 TaxID=1340428 RepID=A0A6A6V595_9PLEO|nr:glycosyltransferase family 22 protein [Sporormia fimetaria CBS 119925]
MQTQPTTKLTVFGLLLALRIVNALTLRTFFQPDEYYQSLEPAWQLAFGQDSQAFITWEWKNQLRSSLHPAIFAAVYRVATKLAALAGVSVPLQADVLIAAPKVTQAVFAALLDLYTWKLAEKVYGSRSRTAYTALALSIVSPWQWLCSTRTLSNCLETTISTIAVYYWPWHWPRHWPNTADKDSDHRRRNSNQTASQDFLGPLSHLRISLSLAAFACLLRPTNALIWLAVAVPTFWQCSTRLRYVLAREVVLCGSAVLAVSAVSDRAYYGTWTFPPLRFLYFNLVQSLAVFYGRNRPDYYLTEGLPLLLTTALPFAVQGLCQALRQRPASPGTPPTGPPSTSSAGKSDETSSSSSATPAVPQHPAYSPSDAVSDRILARLAWTSIIVTMSMSLISHKEVRFLYPILPFLHVLSAKPAASFFLAPTASSLAPTGSPPTPPSQTTPTRLTPSTLRRTLLLLALTLNTTLTTYLSLYHQAGVISVTHYLRTQHLSRLSISPSTTTTVAFLMPCHSTPFRSHLIHPSLTAWSLTCNPPLSLSPSAHSTYLDEADAFYLSPGGPAKWLKENMEHPDLIRKTSSRSARHWGNLEPAKQSQGTERRKWPLYLVFFEQLEETLRDVLRGSRYRECWRGGNGVWNEDWRRRGDVVVWCLE